MSPSFPDFLVFNVPGPERGAGCPLVSQALAVNMEAMRLSDSAQLSGGGGSGATWWDVMGETPQGGPLLTSKENEDREQRHKQEVTKEQHSGSKEHTFPEFPAVGY